MYKKMIMIHVFKNFTKVFIIIFLLSFLTFLFSKGKFTGDKEEKFKELISKFVDNCEFIDKEEKEARRFELEQAFDDAKRNLEDKEEEEELKYLSFDEFSSDIEDEDEDEWKEDIRIKKKEENPSNVFSLD